MLASNMRSSLARASSLWSLKEEEKDDGNGPVKHSDNNKAAMTMLLLAF